MKMRIFTSIAFTLHLLVGSVCMMPMAMAADTPMPHDEAMEMIMTPLEPMSPAQCEHCVYLEKQQPPMNAGCAGHCLSQENARGPTTVQNSAPTLFVATLPSSVITMMHEESVQSFEEANAPPPKANLTYTIVLLQ